ncbi:dUTP diphosphatase [Staphylococcus aureus]|uniref:dUTP diphosphatase n=1 Tax=Staphylococcus aureus TaxID=1280 RepID=UPI001E2A0283|nr:dUTP pyrophosphatase [Staphylococcus aureus]UFA56471.1 dUTP pyrophosphatase [Staphylococcus aureus]
MTNTLQVKLLSENARMPERNHKTDAGYDIFSAETVVLEPQEKAVIKTDVAVSIPEGYVGLLTSRSGVSSKTHVFDIKGEIDLSDAIRQYGTYQINEGDKLAQLVIVPIWTPELKQVEEFECVSERGAKGFGSSGV